MQALRWSVSGVASIPDSSMEKIKSCQFYLNETLYRNPHPLIPHFTILESCHME